MLSQVAGADFGEIVELHGQAEFPRLHLLAAQLSESFGPGSLRVRVELEKGRSKS